MAVGLLFASCGTYYDAPPPYYQPSYGHPYPHYPEQAGPGSQKIENPEIDQSRQFGANPNPGQTPGGRPSGGQTTPGHSPGGGAAPTEPSGPPAGILVPNRPGMIMSPYARDPNKLIDVSGLPSGTVIECPYSQDGRTIRVP